MDLSFAEYTEMVDNLSKVFERATARYLDQISSSDDEVAVEFPEIESDLKTSTKKKKERESTPSKRKPTLAAQTDKKRERSLSDDGISDLVASKEKHDKPVKPTNSVVKNNKKDTKSNKVDKKVEKQNVLLKKNVKSKKNSESKKAKKSKNPSVAKTRRRSLSKSPDRERWSSSPPPSWPPSSPDTPPDFLHARNENRVGYSSDEDTRFKHTGM